MTTDLGFIILRHVNNELTNKYWIRCYKCIRKFYLDNPILIIDDNSDYSFVSNCNSDNDIKMRDIIYHDTFLPFQEQLHNTTIINSEFKKRGELLPYYYYLRHQFCKTAVILHDSVFLNQKMDFTVNDYKMIWDFEHNWDQIEDETKMIKSFDNEELLRFYQDKSLWKGCFGGMAVITYDYLTKINSKYDISKLLDFVLTRYNRCSFERVIACLLQKDVQNKSLLGNIHKYCHFGTGYEQGIKNNKNLPIIKVWTGR